jgi:5-hydroxyisourate hydrolase-like protein (transthyretin family)
MWVATAATVAACALLPATGHADQYIVDHCAGPDGTPGVAFPSIVNPSSVGAAMSNTCGIPGGALRSQFPQGTMQSGDYADFVLSIPDDRPNVQMERIITRYSAPSASGGLVFMPIYNQAFQEIYNAQAPATPEVARPLPPGNRLVRWRVLCAGSPCTFSDQFVLNLFRTRLYLNETVAPTLTVSGGTLVSAGAKSGQPTLAFDANDTDSGVASVTVSLGAAVVASAAYPCGVQDWSVCKRDQANQTLPVDTTKVPDGSHELLIAVRDGANNTLTRSLGAIAVANGAGKLTASYATTRKRSRRLGYRSRPTIRGTLVDQQGQPIVGASVAILQRPRQSGARSTQVATVTTGRDGRFSYKLEAGPSRTLTFAYTAFASDPKPAATSVLRTEVRAILSLAAAPRSPRAGRLMTLSGRLRLLPRAGVEVKIQPRQGRRWYTFGSVKTTKGGRFRWRYRFDSSKRGSSFVFRARVDSPIYPFAAGNSPVIRVHVR